MPEIVKIQLSMPRLGQSQTMLIYNQGKTFVHQGPATSDIQAVMAGESKAYFKARIRKSGNLKIMKRVRPRYW